MLSQNKQLLDAAKSGRLDLVKQAIQKGANINAADEDGQTALILATILNHLNIMSYLVKVKAKVNIVDKYGNTALMWSIMANKRRLMYQEKTGVDALMVKHQYRNGVFEVIPTNDHWNLDAVKCLMEAKADVNVKNTDGRTALILAAIYGNLDIVKCLIEAKADVDVKDKEGNTALTWAAESKHSGIEEYLKSYIQKELWQEYIYVGVGSAIGLALGMAIAYHVGTAIGVCIASASIGLVLGGIAGYVVAEVKKEKDRDPNIDVATALKNVFTTQPLSENVIALKWK